MRRLIVILIACAFLFSLAHIIPAETETQLNISNSPPYLAQNIPDILVIINTPKINAFDLDDYFKDLNGENLIFNYTSLNNVTVTINSENLVSFYPDTNYSGVQPMQFNASDTEETATSNIFQLTVGEDTSPPQWSNPKRNVISVYQNYHVTFTAGWTDNTGLEEFIFSINQGSGWQNQTITPFTGLSNASSFKFQISASANQEVSWAFYAKDIYGNINRTDTQNFTVKEFSGIPGGDYNGTAGDNGSTSTVSGLSYGTGGAKLDYFKEGILAKNLEVDTRNIKVTLKQGASITKIIKIINTGNTLVKINASLKGVNALAILGDYNFEIQPGKTYELLTEFTIPRNTAPDQYFGFLTLSYGDDILIPIVIDVKKFESDIEINVTLTKESKIVRAGEKVTALLLIKNLKDIESSPSQLYYALKDFNGNIIDASNEDISIPDSFEEERTLVAPEEIPDGEYIFYARVISGDSIDLDSDTLLLGARFKIITFLKKFLYPLIILILLIILFLLYLSYKRNKKKKQLLELYLLLNELRKLVKEGKSIEAMDIYKRIKLTYGQHVSKGFTENEIKLKEELEKFSKILKKTEIKPIPSETKPSQETKPSPTEKPSQETKPAPETKPSPTENPPQETNKKQQTTKTK